MKVEVKKESKKREAKKEVKKELRKLAMKEAEEVVMKAMEKVDKGLELENKMRMKASGATRFQPTKRYSLPGPRIIPTPQNNEENRYNNPGGNFASKPQGVPQPPFIMSSPFGSPQSPFPSPSSGGLMNLEGRSVPPPPRQPTSLLRPGGLKIPAGMGALGARTISGASKSYKPVNRPNQGAMSSLLQPLTEAINRNPTAPVHKFNSDAEARAFIKALNQSPIGGASKSSKPLQIPNMSSLLPPTAEAMPRGRNPAAPVHRFKTEAEARAFIRTLNQMKQASGLERTKEQNNRPKLQPPIEETSTENSSSLQLSSEAEAGASVAGNEANYGLVGGTVLSLLQYSKLPTFVVQVSSWETIILFNSSLLQVLNVRNRGMHISDGVHLTPQVLHTRGWRERGNSIRDPGIARTGGWFLVLLLYEDT